MSADHRAPSENKPDPAVFTLADVQAIRYLVLVMGGVGMAMFLITDRDTPLLVVAFITVVTVVPIAAIYLLRRRASRKELNEADAGTKNQRPRDQTATL